MNSLFAACSAPQKNSSSGSTTASTACGVQGRRRNLAIQDGWLPSLHAACSAEQTKKSSPRIIAFLARDAPPKKKTSRSGKTIAFTVCGLQGRKKEIQHPSAPSLRMAPAFSFRGSIDKGSNWFWCS